jgi:hypothetical protein
MNYSFAQNDNIVYMLGQTEDGTKYALQGNWVKDQSGFHYLKNYCLAKIPGKFVSDTSRWEKCGDYTENEGVLETQIITRKVIDPSDSSKFLKSARNKLQDSVIQYIKILQSMSIELEGGMGILNLYGIDVELITIKMDNYIKPNKYVLNEAQNEILEYVYTPFLSLNSGEIEYKTSTSTSFFEPGGQGIMNAFSKSFKLSSGVNDVLVPVVTIGSQIWMSENLFTDHFCSKEVIPKYEDWNTWSSLSTSAYFFHEGNNYYNQSALIDNRNICPAGFHVPNEKDLVELIKTISPDQRNQVSLKKNNKLILNKESNDLKINGLIDKDLDLGGMRRPMKNGQVSLPTNEFLLNLGRSNKILLENYGSKSGGNYRNIRTVFLPFTYKNSSSQKILSLAYGDLELNVNTAVFLPYTKVPNQNIVFFTSDIPVKERRNGNYIPNIENKIGYAVRCIADK